MIGSSRSVARSAPSGAARASAIVFAGVAIAINIGKLPPALPVLQHEFGLSLVQVSWMVSLFMVAPALLGGIAGSAADRFDARTSMIVGLLLSAAASAFGAFVVSPGLLFLSRALESLGSLMTALPAPALIARIVPHERLRGWLGIWSAYMPAGMSVALFATPVIMSMVGWRGVWFVAAAISLIAAVLVIFVHPVNEVSDEAVAAKAPVADDVRILRLVAQTFRSPGPWLLSLCFFFYAGQFTAIFSFLPSIYQDAGLSPQMSASLTAFAVLVSMFGNLASGFLLQQGMARATLVASAGITMAVCAWIAFGSELALPARYVAILLFSASAGLIPGTLFATVPFYAPSIATISTTVGAMQQGSNLGQLMLPLLIAALVQYTGGWSSIWIATGLAAMVTVLIAFAMGYYDRVRPR